MCSLGPSVMKYPGARSGSRRPWIEQEPDIFVISPDVLVPPVRYAGNLCLKDSSLPWYNGHKKSNFFLMNLHFLIPFFAQQFKHSFESLLQFLRSIHTFPTVLRFSDWIQDGGGV